MNDNHHHNNEEDFVPSCNPTLAPSMAIILNAEAVMDDPLKLLSWSTSGDDDGYTDTMSTSSFSVAPSEYDYQFDYYEDFYDEELGNVQVFHHHNHSNHSSSSNLNATSTTASASTLSTNTCGGDNHIDARDEPIVLLMDQAHRDNAHTKTKKRSTSSSPKKRRIKIIPKTSPTSANGATSSNGKLPDGTSFTTIQNQDDSNTGEHAENNGNSKPPAEPSSATVQRFLQDRVKTFKSNMKVIVFLMAAGSIREIGIVHHGAASESSTAKTNTTSTSAAAIPKDSGHSTTTITTMSSTASSNSSISSQDILLDHYQQPLNPIASFVKARVDTFKNNIEVLTGLKTYYEEDEDDGYETDQE